MKIKKKNRNKDFKSSEIWFSSQILWSFSLRPPCKAGSCWTTSYIKRLLQVSYKLAGVGLKGLALVRFHVISNWWHLYAWSTRLFLLWFWPDFFLHQCRVFFDYFCWLWSWKVLIIFLIVDQQCREGQDVLPEQIKAVLLDSAGFHGMM